MADAVTNDGRFDDIELVDTRNVDYTFRTDNAHKTFRQSVTLTAIGRSSPAFSSSPPQHPGAAPEEHTENQDVTYENTNGVEPPGGDVRRGNQTIQVIRKWSLLLFLICLLLCLLLSTAVIVLAVKCISVSGNLKQPKATDHVLTSNVTETLESGEEFMRRELLTTQPQPEQTRVEQEPAVWGDMDLSSRTTQSSGVGGDLTSISRDPRTRNAELEETRLQLEKAQQEMKDLKNTLLHCRQREPEATTERLAMEATRRKMDQWEEEFCPGGWVLFRKRCLWLSDERRTWGNSKTFCEERDSNLIIVPRNDTALQHFLAGRRDGFWVGKELTWMWPKEWNWPSGYPELLETGCWLTRGGTLQNVSCSDDNRWICEKNFVLTSFKGTAYNSLEFSLWGAKFSCYRS